MRGRHVARKAAGTHGLAVEIEVEKRLGCREERHRTAVPGGHPIALQPGCLDSTYASGAMTERSATGSTRRRLTSPMPQLGIGLLIKTLFEKGLCERHRASRTARAAARASSHEVAQNYKGRRPLDLGAFPVRPGGACD
jgi:hypothetical protein